MTNARGCSPLRCMLFSHVEKSRTELGSQCGPGGEEEGRGRWKDPVHYQRRGMEGHKSDPPACTMGTATVLPLCWGKERQEHRRLFPWKRGQQDGFASIAPSHFSESCGGIESACVYTHRPVRPADFLALHRELWRVVGQLQQHPVHRPVTCFPREARTKLRSSGCQG